VKIKILKIFTFFVCLFAIQPNLYSKSGIERSGDILLVLIPVTSFGTTYLVDDEVGRGEFYKSFLLNGSITTALKYGVKANRPDGSGEDSFPSAHTSITFQSASFIHKRYGLNYALPFYIASSYVGWSRVDSKKHYTRDVVVGGLIGSLSSFYFTSTYKNLAIVPTFTTNSIGLEVGLKW